MLLQGSMYSIKRLIEAINAINLQQTKYQFENNVFGICQNMLKKLVLISNSCTG